MNNCSNNSGNCINEILNVILVLQENACPDNCLDTCDRGFLGCCATSVSCNPRPVMLYTCGCNSVAWSMPISKDPNETSTSNIFRVEKIDGCCATFRVLIPNTDTTESFPYEATNSFFTINLNCVCALRCLQDTHVDCI